MDVDSYLHKFYLVLSALFSALLSLAIYNAFFHPLAKIPGPLLAKVTDLWHVYHIKTGRRHMTLLQLHRKYGRMVRLGPNTVSVDSEEGLRKIYSATSLIEKSPFYKAFTPGFTSSFSTLDGAYKEKKAIVAPAFAPKKLDAMEQIVVSHITSLCKSLKTETEIFLDESLSALTIDILSDVCFGQTLDLLHNPSEKEKISSGLEKAAAYISVEGTLWRWPLIMKISQMITATSGRYYPAQRAIGAMVNQRQHPSGRDDIFNTLLTAKKPGSDELYSDKDLFGEAIVLFVAGSDTTSTAMLTMLWHLLSHRDTYDNLVKEMRDNFESFGDVSYSKLQHLPYLRAVIEEGLRIFPPNAGFIPRIVSKSDDVFSIHETVLPPGTEIGVSNISLHRNALYFEDPDSFLPDRWINKTGVPKCDKNAFSPFSRGPRSCLGRSMAYMEMSLVLAALCLEVDLKFKYPELEAQEGYLAKDAFVLVRPKVPVLVSPRKFDAKMRRGICERTCDSLSCNGAHFVQV